MFTIKKNYDLVIIGGGSAGMAAALEAYKLKINNILIIERNHYLGGILNQCIHNGFGINEFKENLTGPEFMIRLSDQIKKKNIPYILDSTVQFLTRDKDVCFSNTKGFYCVHAKAILITTGCYEKNIGSIMLNGDRSSGIFTAGTAQLYANIYGCLVGKRVFILGSGNIGLIMARRLTLEGAKVVGVAEICSYSNGSNSNMLQCLKDYHIPLYLSHTISCINSKKGKLESIMLAPVNKKKEIIYEKAKKYYCDALILSVGLIPNITLLRDIGIEMNKNKNAIINENYETSIPGIFVAGNALHVHDIVDMVVRESRLVISFVKNYLSLKHEKNQLSIYINVVIDNNINYVLPQRISINNNHDIIFKMRVCKPMKNIDICFYDEKNKLIKKNFKNILVPSEMIEINLSLQELKQFHKKIIIKLEKTK